jgi:hypothetical protein
LAPSAPAADAASTLQKDDSFKADPPPPQKKMPITKQHKQATYCTLNEATSSAVTIRINNAW